MKIDRGDNSVFFQSTQCPMSGGDTTHWAGKENTSCPWCVNYNLDPEYDGSYWFEEESVKQAIAAWARLDHNLPTPEELLNPQPPVPFSKPVVPGRRRIQRKGMRA